MNRKRITQHRPKSVGSIPTEASLIPTRQAATRLSRDVAPMANRTFFDHNFGVVSSSVLHASMAIHRLANLINEQQQRLESIMTSINDGIILLNENGLPIYQNRNGEMYLRKLCRCSDDMRDCPIHPIIREVDQNDAPQRTEHILHDDGVYEVTVKKIQTRREASKTSIIIKKSTRLDAETRENIHRSIAPLIKEMIAALAHEINNPLTPIMTLSNSYWSEGARPTESPKNLEIIHHAGERITRVMQQLLKFNQVYQEGEDKQVELNSALRLMIDHVKKDFPGFNIHLDTHTKDCPIYVNINDAQFQQIMLFLLYSIQSQTQTTKNDARICIATHEENGAQHLQIAIHNMDLPYYYPEDADPSEKSTSNDFRDIHLILADLLAQLNQVRLTFDRDENGTKLIRIAFTDKAA